MNLRTIYARNPWLASSRTLLAIAIAMTALAGARMAGGSSALVGLALALITLAGVGGVTLERRDRSRQAVRKPIFCHALGCHDVLDGQTQDISVGGFFVATESPYPVLTRLRFELVVDHMEHPIQGQGIVRWVRFQKHRGMGVEIVRLDDPARYGRFVRQDGPGKRPPQLPGSGAA